MNSHERKLNARRHFVLARQAFTLIELLVVIAIIGILATVSIVALNNARAKSRDAKRLADIKNIQTALALYYSDKEEYPITLTSGQPLFSTSLDGDGNMVTTTFMSSVPSAPTPADGANCNTTNNVFTYVTSSDLQSYTLSTCVASPPQTAASSSGAAIYIADPAQSQPCGQYIIDYAGQKYRTVQVGTQCWMRDNLNVGTMLTITGNNCAVPFWVLRECAVNNDVIEKYCYSNTAANCLTDGGLYEWSEAMAFPWECNFVDFRSGLSTCGTANTYRIATPHRGICPPGWHIPSNSERYTLESYLTDPDQTCSSSRDAAWYATNGWGCDTAGTKMKIGGSSGFDGLLAGLRNAAYNNIGGGEFRLRASYGMFWSSTPGYYAAEFDRVLGSTQSKINRWYGEYGSSGLSVRCIKD